MKWRRWIIALVCVLALAGLYSARRPILTSFLSAKFSTRIESQSLETSFEDTAVALKDAKVKLPNGRHLTVDQATAKIDTRTLWRGDLVIDQLDLQGVRIPMQIPVSTKLSFPALPDEFGALPDVQSWLEPWLADCVSRIDRDADRLLATTQELHSRTQQLQSELDRTIASIPSNLHDRKYALAMAREYHAVKQRLAEVRIHVRTIGKDHSKKWSGVAESITEKFQTRLLELAPDADRQIHQLATIYSQRITPTVLAYCDLVAAVTAQGPIASEHLKPSSSTLVRKAAFAGELIDLANTPLRVPFECQGCQWSCDSSANLPTTSVWSFALPDGQGSLEIQAERRVKGPLEPSEQNPLYMNCFWYPEKGHQPFQANPNRVRVEVQQSQYERVVSVTAPWDSRQQTADAQKLALSPLGVSFRQMVRTQDRAKQRTVPVAWESVAVEPRILFEMENALEERKKHWMSQAQARWSEIAPAMIASKQEESTNLWQSLATKTMEQLKSLDEQLEGWQKRWDSSTSLEQHRVGGKLSSHPDAYSLGAK